jgi:hypothetical protein
MEMEDSSIKIVMGIQMSQVDEHRDVTYSGWLFGTWFLFFHILGIIIPTD